MTEPAVTSQVLVRMPYQYAAGSADAPCRMTGAAAVPLTVRVPATSTQAAGSASESITTVPASMRSSLPAGTVMCPLPPRTT